MNKRLCGIIHQRRAETRRIHSRFQSGQDGLLFGPGDIPIFRFRLTAQLCRDPALADALGGLTARGNLATLPGSETVVLRATLAP